MERQKNRLLSRMR